MAYEKSRQIFSLTNHKLKFTSKKYSLCVYSDANLPKGTTVFVRGVSPSKFKMLIDNKEVEENPSLDIPEVTDDDDDGLLKKMITGKTAGKF